MPHRSILLALLALLAVLAVAACDVGETSEVSGAYTVSASEAVEMIESGDRTVIDVRTPAEFDLAHVLGALNIDLEGPDFADRIAKLDPDEPYLVYCQSGRRSAAAAALMAEAGVADIADAGGLADLARAGASVVE